MFSLIDLKAGEFIDLENYFKQIVEEDYTNLDNFYLLLLKKIPKEESVLQNAIELFIKQLTEIKQTYEWIYNPPEMPTDAEQKEATIGDEYRKDFAEDYGGYIEMIYLICKGDILRVKEVLEMPVIDFLFYGEYLLRKKIVENIK